MDRLSLWFAGTLVVLIALLISAVSLSPWAAVAVVRYVFSRGDQSANAALEKHAPHGIMVRPGIAYGSAPDEVLDLYYRQGAAMQPAIVWVHGGGFVAGSTSGIANYMRVLAGHGYTVIAVEYSRGRGATYPRPVEQVNAALGFVARHAAALKVDATMIVLAGDSAGAHIASQVALVTTAPGYARALGISPQLKPNQLSAMLLLSGLFDPSALNYQGRLGWFLQAVLWTYSGIRDFQHDKRFEQMSVTRHVTGAFPASFISSGNGDPLAPQAIALSQRLQALGVHTDVLFFPASYVPALAHGYQFDLDQTAGQEALARMLAFLASIRAATPGSQPSLTATGNP